MPNGMRVSRRVAHNIRSRNTGIMYFRIGPLATTIVSCSEQSPIFAQQLPLQAAVLLFQLFDRTLARSGQRQTAGRFSHRLRLWVLMPSSRQIRAADRPPCSHISTAERLKFSSSRL